MIYKSPETGSETGVRVKRKVLTFVFFLAIIGSLLLAWLVSGFCGAADGLRPDSLGLRVLEFFIGFSFFARLRVDRLHVRWVSWIVIPAAISVLLDIHLDSLASVLNQDHGSAQLELAVLTAGSLLLALVWWVALFPLNTRNHEVMSPRESSLRRTLQVIAASISVLLVAAITCGIAWVHHETKPNQVFILSWAVQISVVIVYLSSLLRIGTGFVLDVNRKTREAPAPEH